MAVDTSGWVFRGGVFLVGPVIGAVDKSSVRLLVETSVDVEVQLTALAGGKTVSRAQSGAKARTPTAFLLKGLPSGASITVEVTAAGETRQAQFRTLGEKKDWKIGMVSCNNHKYTQGIKLWEKLALEVGTLDCIIHMGDQVYADETFFRSVNPSADVDSKRDARESSYGRARALLIDKHPSVWKDHIPEVLELYREVYRLTWNFPAVAKVLASASNYMILDDHEVVDDLGDLEEHANPNSMEGFIIRVAYQVYMEYQMQLYRGSVRVTDPGTPAFGSFKLGTDLGIFLLDVRLARSIQKKKAKNPNQEYLGPDQWAALQKALTSDLKGCKALLVVSPTPVMLLSSVAVDFASNFTDDVRGAWGNKRFHMELVNFLRLLSDWQAAKPSRGLCILSGDAHIGGFTEGQIRNKVPPVNQIVSSAIGNEAPVAGLANKLIAKVALELAEIRTSIKVDHNDFVFEPNFGTLAIGIAGGSSARPTFKGTLHTGKGETTRDLRTSVTGSGGGCCSIS